MQLCPANRFVCNIAQRMSQTQQHVSAASVGGMTHQSGAPCATQACTQRKRRASLWNYDRFLLHLRIYPPSTNITFKIGTITLMMYVHAPTCSEQLQSHTWNSASSPSHCSGGSKVRCCLCCLSVRWHGHPVGSVSASGRELCPERHHCHEPFVAGNSH